MTPLAGALEVIELGERKEGAILWKDLSLRTRAFRLGDRVVIRSPIGSAYLVRGAARLTVAAGNEQHPLVIAFDRKWK